MAGGSKAQIFEAMLLGGWKSKTGGRRLKGVTARPSREDLVFLNGLLEAGRVVPVIDKRYPLREAAEAFRYLGTGHARGKVVVTMNQGG
jgi:NADPH:quinone reductase-like Zn-dependent oxidoreductase